MNWSCTYEEFKQMDKDEYFTLPENDVIGLYRILDHNGKIIYVGKTLSTLNRRLVHHEYRYCGSKIEVMTGLSKADINFLEIYFIVKYKPKYNKDCKPDDDFSFDFSHLEKLLPEWREFIPYEYVERMKKEKREYLEKKKAENKIIRQQKEEYCKHLASIFEENGLNPRIEIAKNTSSWRIKTYEYTTEENHELRRKLMEAENYKLFHSENIFPNTVDFFDSQWKYFLQETYVQVLPKT